MAIALQITAVPHCILVDPHAIVRYEGMPGYLDDEKLRTFFDEISVNGAARFANFQISKPFHQCRHWLFAKISSCSE